MNGSLRRGFNGRSLSLGTLHTSRRRGPPPVSPLASKELGATWFRVGRNDEVPGNSGSKYLLSNPIKKLLGAGKTGRRCSSGPIAHLG